MILYQVPIYYLSYIYSKNILRLCILIVVMKYIHNIVIHMDNQQLHYHHKLIQNNQIHQMIVNMMHLEDNLHKEDYN